MRAVLAIIPVAVIACSPAAGIQTLPDNTVDFHGADASFTVLGGTYSLYVADGDDTAGGIPTGIGFIITDVPALSIGQPMAVGLEPFQDGQSGWLPPGDDDQNDFSWTLGTSPVDASALTSVTLTIDAWPASPSDDGVFVLRMQFSDGRVYDARITVALETCMSTQGGGGGGAGVP